MARCGSRACWFGLGAVLGAAVGSACAMLVRTAAEQRVLRQRDAPLVPSDPAADQALTDTATDVVEYGGFVIHVYCHALGMGRFKALCDIWESGAVVLEGGAPPATHATPEDARAAAISWARQWVQHNG
ncbi:hypothetical protein D8I24_7297 [Cupriavidus necator H850]|jgi:hypothetical protein|nr:hypothetical protein CF68_21585 [Cupriavidus sp. SK-4]KAI3596523.1 hypothetical protein D8I24_7297 [Cupriavidus necator H850]QUN29666.1 hypothetical protein KB879_06970 [Cupriavidus sp. KK10]